MELEVLDMKKRLFRFALLFLFIYSVASTVFLNFVMTKWINGSTDEVHIEQGFAYSILPGIVSVHNFTFRLQDSNVQLFFHMPSVRVNVGVFALLRREFHTSSVKAEELKFYFRFRRDKKDLAGLSLAALPQILGLNSIERDPPKPENTSEPFNPWKIQIKNIQIKKMTELWFEEFRYRGEVAINGGFYLFPKTKVEIFPTQIDFKSGSLTVENILVSRDTRGTIRAVIERFDPNQVPGLDLFKHATGEIHLKSAFNGTGFVNYYLKEIPHLQFSGGQGLADINLFIEKGEFSPESEFTIGADNLRVHLWEQRALGHGEVQWSAKQGSTLSLRLSDYRLFSEKHPEYYLGGEYLKVSVQSPDRRIHVPFKNVRWGLDIPQARLNDLRYWNYYLPKTSKLQFRGGVAQVKAQIRSGAKTENRDEGEIEVKTKNAQIVLSRALYTGAMQVNAQFDHSNIPTGKISLPVLKVDISGIESREAKVKNWALVADLSRAQFQLGEDSEIRSPIKVQATDAVPFLTVIEDQKKLPGWVADVLPLSNLKAFGDFFSGKDRIEVSNVVLDSKNAKVQGWIEKERRDTEMRLLIKAEPVAVGFERIQGKSAVRLHEAEKWFWDREEKSAD